MPTAGSPQQHRGLIEMKLLRTKTVAEMTGLSRMTIYRLESSGLFPRRIKLSRNSIAWRDEDINEWIRTRPLAPPYQGVRAIESQDSRRI